MNALMRQMQDDAAKVGDAQTSGLRRLFSDHVAGLNAYTQQAVKAKSATQAYTEALVKQEVGLRQAMKSRQQFNDVLKEQYQLQQMTAVQWSRNASGTMSADIIVPKGASAEIEKYTSSLKNNVAGLLEARAAGRSTAEAMDVLRMRMGMANQVLASVGENMVKWGKNTQWAGRQLMVGFTMPFMVFGAVAGKAAYDADKSLSQIAKVYDFSAKAATDAAQRTAEAETLRANSMKLASQVAHQYGVSTKDTLDVEKELAATGLSGQNLMKSTAEVVRGATLGQLDYTQAIKATVAMQTVYGMSATEVGKAFNYMNAIANATSLDMQSFVDAIPRGAGVMKQLGVSLYEMGPLLTAMKQGGISAAEGMNGLRSAALRLLKITPQTEKLWDKLLPNAGSLKNIVSKDKGDFIKIINDMGTAMKQLEPYQRTQILAQVFGIYQSNKIYSVMDGLINKTGQVAKAYEIMGQSSQDWATTAQQGMKDVTDSASGKLHRAIEGIKADLIAAGKPFMAFAAMAINFFGVIVKGFNALPSGAKWAAVTVAALLAIAGPLIMVAGLFGNMWGQAVKAAAGMAGLFSKFRAQTAEQKAQEMLAKKSSLAWNNQANAAKALATAIGTLTGKMEELVLVQRNLAGDPITGYGNPEGYIGPTPPSLKQDANGKYRRSNGQFASTTEVAAMQAAERAAQGVADDSVKTERNWKSIAGKMPALGMGAALTAQMVAGSNELVGKFTNILMIASMVGPIMTKAMLASAAKIKATSLFSSVAGVVGGIATRLGGSLAGVGKSLAGVGATIAGYAGPIALVGGAAAFAIMKINSETAKARKLVADVEEASKGWAETLGYVYQEQVQINKATKDATPPLEVQAEEMAKKNKGLKEYLESQRALSDEAAKQAAIHQGILASQHGANADQASQVVRVSLQLAGYKSDQIDTMMADILSKVDFSKTQSVLDAQASQFVDQFWKVANNKFKQGNWEGFGRMFSGTGNLNAGAGKAGKEMADQFFDAWVAQTNGADRLKMWTALQNAVNKGGHDIFNQLSKTAAQSFQDAGIKGFEQLMKAFNDYQNMPEEDFTKKYGSKADVAFASLSDGDIAKMEKYRQAEENIAREIAKRNGVSDKEIGNIHTLIDVQKYLDQATMTVAQASANYTDAMNKAEASGRYLTETEKLAILNTYRHAAGMDDATSSAQGFGTAIVATAEALKEQAAAATAATLTQDNLQSAWQNAMQGAQGAMFQAADSIWSRAAQSQSDAIQKAGDAQNAALDKQAQTAADRFEARGKALDRKWQRINKNFDDQWNKRMDAVKKAYDDRIQKVKDEIDAEDKAEKERQRIFEAEKQRLSEMADLANKAIDFNVAMNTGNLDEAAKIYNDMQSTQDQYAIDQASANDQSASDARKDALNKKIDAITKERDARIEALQKVEDAEKQALQDQQDREKEALDAEKRRFDASIQAQRDYINKRTQADIRANQEELDRKKNLLDLELATIRANVPRSQAEYNAQIAAVEAAYQKYGVRLEGYGDSWTKYIATAFNSNMATAAAGLQNQINWQSIASTIAGQFTQGAFNMSISDFMQWMATGKMPESAQKYWSNPSSHQPVKTGGRGRGGPNAMHGGGTVGAARDNRRGRSLDAPLLPSEHMIVAEKGEYVIRREAHQALGTQFLDAINSGVSFRHAGGPVGVVNGLMGGMMSAIIQSVMSAQIQQAGDKAFQQAQNYFAPDQPGVYGGTQLGADQLANASRIIAVGRSMGASIRDLIVGIMTALQESDLKNINYGDRDSLGLFQQRPSQGWGTPDQIMNPDYAARKFFEGLLAIKDRNNMPLTLEAQAVQRSAYPYAYAKWEDVARAIVSGGGGYGGGNVGGWGQPGTNLETRSHAGLSWTQNRLAGSRFSNLIDELISSGYRPRIVEGYNYKGIEGSPNTLSNHAYGAAVDIDPSINPRYASSAGGPYALPRNSSILAHRAGLYWGGDYHHSKDYMHFEVLGAPATPRIPGLSIGGTVRYDNTIANLHRDEKVLTAPLSKSLERGIERIDRGLASAYNVTVDLRGATIAEQVDMEKAIETGIAKFHAKKESQMGRNRTIN